MSLNDRERLVVNCKLMRLNEGEALAYLHKHGHDISTATYWRIRAKVEGEKLKRLYEIAQKDGEFVDMHLERIDELYLIKQLMWKNYWQEETPTGRTSILKSIMDMQPYISSYLEATKEIMEQNAEKVTGALPDITAQG